MLYIIQYTRLDVPKELNLLCAYTSNEAECSLTHVIGLVYSISYVTSRSKY